MTAPATKCRPYRGRRRKSPKLASPPRTGAASVPVPRMSEPTPVTAAQLLDGKRKMARQLAERGWDAGEIAATIRISTETVALWLARDARRARNEQRRRRGR